MFNFGEELYIWTHSIYFQVKILILLKSDGKSLQFDELLAYPTFWEQIWFDEKIRDRDLPEPVKLHQPHLISGTVALADITEQTRVYHYKRTNHLFSSVSVQNYRPSYKKRDIKPSITAF